MLTPLPFAEDALEPFISELTISTHYNKHHAGYVKKLNKQRAENEVIADKSVLDIIQNADDFPEGIVNNAAQIYNHEFYWNCIAPMAEDKEKESRGPEINGVVGISQSLYDAISAEMDGFDNFKEVFKTRAKKHFGSGWLWLMLGTDGKLKLAEGHDAQNPIMSGETPLLTIDIWEHAYYLDYMSDRGIYVDVIFERINWQFVSQQFENALASKQEL